MKHLLVIDDEPSHRLMLRAVLEDADWKISEAGSGEEGLKIFTEHQSTIKVVVVDMKMPGMDGQATLAKLHKISPNLPVILLTAYGTVGAAVEAMRSGAFDYLAKPADNDELLLTINRAYAYASVAFENTRLKAEMSGEESIKSLVGSTLPMRQMHELIRQAAPSEATVLITGESGTGKELIAHALHHASQRRKAPFIKVNCAAIPSQLLESELFGYEKGAFTGAIKDKPGRFLLASGGSIFLDEIGELPMDLQAKLLRVIQERVIEPLGSVKTRAIDVRIIAATNKSLRLLVAANQFREDLFFRLNVLEIEAPPLRQRMDDLPLLANYLLQKLAAKNKKLIRGISPAFLHALSLYHWPGNVRELENILERALILSRSDILELSSLPTHIFASPSGALNSRKPVFVPSPMHTMGFAQKPMGMEAAINMPQLPPAEADMNTPQQPHVAADMNNAGKDTHNFDKNNGLSPLEQAERTALLQALHQYQGHREKTAESLGISRRTLQYKLKKFGLSRR